MDSTLAHTQPWLGIGLFFCAGLQKQQFAQRLHGASGRFTHTQQEGRARGAEQLVGPVVHFLWRRQWFVNKNQPAKEITRFISENVKFILLFTDHATQPQFLVLLSS